ncbi:MAG: T9SS type A sorting domain-containing protein [Bacteroidia bacterium]|nr:T9SS type A sorting domain-containing protein [Bacteroidia bacterium]
MKTIVNIVVIIISLSLGKLYSQVSCSGSYNTTGATCQSFTVGNGSPGAIVLCLTTNNIPGGPGNSCNPGGSCNPPFSGGGWAPRISIFTTGGTLVNTWTSTTPAGTCYTISTTNGYAVIYGLCLTAGTTITWNTVNQCGSSVCTPPPACPGQPCSTCASSCPACGFATNPTVAQVTSSCPGQTFAIPFGSGQNYTMCASFTAATNTVSFNVIIQSNCGAGNVSNFSWTLQNAACGGILQSGTLSNLTFTNLTVGATYVYCYAFTVPVSPYCQHTIHWPYFVGAVPLPIELTSFDVFVTGDSVNLTWITATEKNNDYFIVEKSSDAINFAEVEKVNGAGNSNKSLSYGATDVNPLKGTSYYRLKQVDFDGSISYSKLKTISFNEEMSDFSVIPNPANDEVTIKFNCKSVANEMIHVYNHRGDLVLSKEVQCSEGINNTTIDVSGMNKGLYFVFLNTGENFYKQKLIVN